MKSLQLATILVLLSIIFNITMAYGMPDEGFSQLNGKVFETTKGIINPIGFAKVAIYDDEELIDKGRTRTNGSYYFMLKPGMYTIRVEETRYIPQKAFVILEPDSTLEIDFNLELKSPFAQPYEALIIIEGFPEGHYPEMLVNGRFYGYALNNTKIDFKAGTFHTIELRELGEDYVKYVLTKPVAYISEENSTALFQYLRQFYIISSTNPWLEGWYEEDSILHLEAREFIELDNSTRLVFYGWLKNGTFLRENSINMKVNSSFHVNSKYRRQYLLTVSFDKGTVKGGGWFDEGTITEISMIEKEVGAFPYKYRFIGWKGDFESYNATSMVLINEPKVVYAEWERVELVKFEKLDPVYKAIITISLLIFAAKILGGIFIKVKLPEVLGELSAGMILGPYALGGLHVFGEPLVELNEYILIFAEIGAILLLFIAGLEISFGSFKAVGVRSGIIGVFGVVIPFFLGLYALQFFGIPWEVNLLVAATLTATSIAITMRTLEEMGKLNSLEGNIMINAAVIDDILGLVVLAAVLSIVTLGAAPHPFDIAWLLFRTIVFWLLLLASMLVIAPRVVGAMERWRTREAVEVFSTATCFGSAVAATVIGLSPIIGAFAAGMALASSRVIARVREYIKKLSTLFAPIFFAVIGAEFNIRALSFEGLGLILILFVVAIISKLAGCGVPAAVMLRDRKRGFRIGIGMMSRGEVGLIIAGIGVTSGIMNQSIYSTVVVMVILTTVITAIALRWSFRKPHVTSKNSKMGKSIEV